MFRLGGILIWLAGTSLALAAPKVAMVRVNEIYRELPSTVELAGKVQSERQAITEDPRLAAYRAVFAELQTLQKELKEAGLSDEQARTRLERDFAIKRQEARTLQREYEEFRDQRLGEINAGMVERMEVALARIAEVAAAVGREKGYDLVLDVSGKTNTGLPFVLYSKQPDDITEQVVQALAAPAADTASQP